MVKSKRHRCPLIWGTWFSMVPCPERSIRNGTYHAFLFPRLFFASPYLIFGWCCCSGKLSKLNRLWLIGAFDGAIPTEMSVPLGVTGGNELAFVAEAVCLLSAVVSAVASALAKHSPNKFLINDAFPLVEMPCDLSHFCQLCSGQLSKLTWLFLSSYAL
jgi:hypothetical protein